MSKSKQQKSKPVSSSPLLQAWIEAAAEWKELRSDPAETRCRAARAAFYLAVFGEVPELPTKAGNGIVRRDAMSDLPPRELAKALLRHDSARNMIADPSVLLNDVVKAIRRGGAGAGGGWPDRNYEVQVEGLHVVVRWAQGTHHEPPIRFTTHELVKEMRTEASSPIAVGDHVRIIQHSEGAYPPPYRKLIGIAGSAYVTPATKVRRWLVDYGEHHSGRLNVREEHLERVTQSPESTIAS